jgi:ABC-2 type transport system permease protein
MNKLWVITLSVFKKNIKSIGFWTMVLSPILSISIAIAIGYFTINKDSQNCSIAIISENQELKLEFLRLKSTGFKFKSAKNEKQVQKQMQDEKIDGYLKIETSKNSVIHAELYDSGSIKNKADSMQQILQTIQQKINAAKLNLSAADLTKLNSYPQFKKTQISFDENGKVTTKKDKFDMRHVASIVFTVLIVLFIMTYFSMIAMEIANEKGTRSMEIILSSIESKTHFYGKILGMVLLAIVHFSIYAIAVICFCLTNLGKSLLQEIHLGDIFSGLFWWIIPFTLVSIFLSMCLAALAGSLVSRTEDAQKTMQPFVILAMLAFYLPMILSNDPTNIILRVVSYIPYMSAFVMPSQLANAVASTSQVVISFTILIIFTGALLSFSANLYKSNVLLYSDNGLLNNLKQSLKNARIEILASKVSRKD